MKGSSFAMQTGHVKDLYSLARTNMWDEICSLSNFPGGKCGEELWCGLLNVIFTCTDVPVAFPSDMLPT